MTSCLECGRATSRTFCSTLCRKGWNNRRAVRGAELYDLFMALRFDRETATALKVWRIMCRAAQLYRQEDVEERAGRRSWGRTADVMERRPYLFATTVANNITGAKR